MSCLNRFFQCVQFLIEKRENIEQSVNQSNIIIKIVVICENNAAGILLPGILFPPPAIGVGIGVQT